MSTLLISREVVLEFKYLRFPWLKIRKLFVLKLKNVLNTLNPTPVTNSNANLNNSSFYNNEGSTSMNESNNTSLVAVDQVKEIKERIIERMESFTRYGNINVTL